MPPGRHPPRGRAERLGLKEPTLPITLWLVYYSINQFYCLVTNAERIETVPNDPWPHYYLGLYEGTVTENFWLP
jgi:hypothetical protein